MDEKKKKHIVVVGGGFAGINLIRRLDTEQFRVTLVDRNNYHAFPPLFYQVASSGLEPAAVCFPFRQKLFKKNIRYCWGRLLRVDTERRTVVTTTGELSYDMLVLALGCETNYFGNRTIESLSFSLKSTSEAIALRNQILSCLELAATCRDDAERRALLSFVVVGGGPTGIEIAGALGEMKKYVLAREYREIRPDEVRVVLAEGSDRLLRNMSEKASQKALSFLSQLEVEVLLNSQLEAFDGREARFGRSLTIPSKTVIWTAGITGIRIDGLPDSVYTFQNRISVDLYNRVDGFDRIFALGDLCAMVTDDYPHAHPQIAPVAIQQAIHLAKNLNCSFNCGVFRYRDKGSMATVGRNRAVVDLSFIHIQGRIAWFIWLLIHILTLLGVKNKIVTFIDWIWNYFTYSSSLRLLIQPDCRTENEQNHPS